MPEEREVRVFIKEDHVRHLGRHMLAENNVGSAEGTPVYTSTEPSDREMYFALGEPAASPPEITDIPESGWRAFVAKVGRLLPGLRQRE